jgi:hypothetical protein
MLKCLFAIFMILSSFQETVSPFPKASSLTSVWTFPAGFMEKKGKVISRYFSDSATRIQIGKVIIYQFRGVQTLENKLIENTVPFFIYSEKDSIGISLKNISDTAHGEKIPTNVFFATQDQIDYEIYLPSVDSFRQVTNKKYSSGRYALIQQFVPRYPTTTGLVPDTTSFYFSKASYPGLWLSRPLDSATGLKLAKVTLFYKRNYDASNKRFIPASQSTAELRTVSHLTPSKGIMALYNWYERYRKGLLK